MAIVIECYEICKNQNMSDAALNLGALYYNGIHIKCDYKKAFESYKIAADAWFGKRHLQHCVLLLLRQTSRG